MFILINILSCGQTSAKFDIGRLNGNLYSNSYFAFKLPVDSIWYIMNRERLDQLINARKALIRENANKDVKISKGSDILLSLTLDTVENMPQILLSSVDLTQLKNITSEKSYLDDYYKKTLDMYKNLDINFSTSEVTTEKINARSFFTNPITIKRNNFIAYQRRFCLKIHSRLLCIMTNYKTSEQLAQSNALLNQIKWD